ncbi:hypothetical protein [uncultured Ruegeria sp.]|uniref:hypothetical protein n=1 Tax=uncultured Ruegeria sp. TaxID=259304 RepID=UPI0026023928|nr:hypothetical protein [uncultured Ruegeria sp.]
MTTTLITKAQKGLVEVEDITRLAKKPSSRNAELLRDLAAKHDWKQHPCFPEAPLATWAEIVATYCVDGFDGVALLADDQVKRPLVFGFLEDIPSDQSLAATLRIAALELSSATANREMSLKVASALNIFGLSKVKPQGVEAVRDFLHKLLSVAGDESEIGTVFWALRWYGDEQTIDLIREFPAMSDHWESARRAAIRAIKKRN